VAALHSRLLPALGIGPRVLLVIFCFAAATLKMIAAADRLGIGPRVLLAILCFAKGLCVSRRDVSDVFLIV
jgi:UPF0716 family protein affecting phage T7 exclusion